VALGVAGGLMGASSIGSSIINGIITFGRIFINAIKWLVDKIITGAKWLFEHIKPYVVKSARILLNEFIGTPVSPIIYIPAFFGLSKAIFNAIVEQIEKSTGIGAVEKRVSEMYEMLSDTESVTDTLNVYTTGAFIEELSDYQESNDSLNVSTTAKEYLVYEYTLNHSFTQNEYFFDRYFSILLDAVKFRLYDGQGNYVEIEIAGLDPRNSASFLILPNSIIRIIERFNKCMENLNNKKRCISIYAQLPDNVF
jgi:hypothetical protein